MSFKKSELKIEFFKAPGPGGQHKNKRAAAVRISHLATGLTAVGTRERSQGRNVQFALEGLKEKLIRLRKKRKKRIPTALSVFAKEEILRRKRFHSLKKQSRRKVDMSKELA